MRHPVSGQKLTIGDYFRGRSRAHAWGILGGLIWGFGTICSFVAAYTPMVGPATSFSLGEGNTMISAVWGVFVWKEFRGASGKARHLLALMFVLFVLGLFSISLAPVVQIEGYGCGNPLRRHHHRDGSRWRNACLPSCSLGQTNFASGTRRIPAEREGQLGLPRRFSRIEIPGQGNLVRQGREKVSLRGFNITSAGIRRSMARRCCGFARRTSEKSGIMPASHPHGR